MNWKNILILIIGLFPYFLPAQYFEAGITGGFAQYLGDLQDGYEARENNLSFGAFFRYNQSRNLAFRAQFYQATLSGKDAYQKASNEFQFNRNLSFQSTLYELSAVGEWSLLKWDVRDGKTTAPYVFGGLGMIYNNPRAQLAGTWYDLQNMGTEGQTLEGGKKYSKLNLAIPVGAGLKISLSDRINLGFELGYRFSMTDYLDDVSGNYPDLGELEKHNPTASLLSFRTPEILPQLAGNPKGKPRGNPNTKDGYFMGMLTLSFNLVEGYGLEFDEQYKKFSPNYRPKLNNLRKVKREIKKEQKTRGKRTEADKVSETQRQNLINENNSVKKKKNSKSAKVLSDRELKKELRKAKKERDKKLAARGASKKETQKQLKKEMRQRKKAKAKAAKKRN